MNKRNGAEILQGYEACVRGQRVGRPRCIHPAFWKLLELLAWSNPDAEVRSRVASLAPRLAQTGSTSKVVSVRLAIHFADEALACFESVYPTDDRPRRALEAVRKWYEDPSPSTTAEVEATAREVEAVVEATREEYDAPHHAACAAESAVIAASIDVVAAAASFRADYRYEVLEGGADPDGLDYAYANEAEELHQDAAAAVAEGAFGALLNADPTTSEHVLLHRLLDNALQLYEQIAIV